MIMILEDNTIMILEKNTI